MTKYFLISTFLFFSLTAQAQQTVLVHGVVVSFDKEKIVLVNGKSKINVPRSSYPDLKKVSVGHSIIEVRMTPEQMYLFNPPAERRGK